jgi:hypothetical protein
MMVVHVFVAQVFLKTCTLSVYLKMPSQISNDYNVPFIGSCSFNFLLSSVCSLGNLNTQGLRSLQQMD